MFLWRCCSLVLLSLFVSVGSELPPSNYAIYSRDVVFVFDRQYAQIFIYPGSINNSWYKLVFTHLEEYDANFQQKYADVEFGRNFTYTPIFHDDTVQNLNMTAFLSSGAHVIINNFVYSKPTTIHYGGETFTFHASSLRFNIQISSWKFQNTTNKLHFHMSIYSSRSKETDIGKNFVKLKGSDNDTLFVEFPQIAIVDDHPKNITIAVDFANEDDQPVDVALLFDHFSDMLSYDPDMGVVFASPRIRDNTHTFSLAALILMGIAGFLAAIFGGGVAFFVWRRRQLRRRYIRYY